MYLAKLARGVVLALILIQVLLCCGSLNEKFLEIEAHTGSGAVGDQRARHITRENARICYGANESSWFEVYTLVAGLESHHVDAIVRNTLEWTERHGVRFCIRKHKVDASRSGSWNKVNFSNARVDELVAAMGVETDLDKRNAMIAEAWDITQDDVTYLPLHHQVVNQASKSNVDVPIRMNNEPLFRFANVN